MFEHTYTHTHTYIHTHTYTRNSAPTSPGKMGMSPQNTVFLSERESESVRGRE